MEYADDVQAKMRDGESLTNRRSSVTGARGNIDVDEFAIINSGGNFIGTMTVREEMDPHHPFHTRRIVTRSDK